MVLGAMPMLKHARSSAMKSAMAKMVPELKAWRHDFHKHPELAFEEIRTSRLVAERLESFGVDRVARRIGRTGVVGQIVGTKASAGHNTRKVGLRADMDALPIDDEGVVAHRSTIPNRAHLCGHDGHTTMLLGAAKYLSAHRNLFSGTVNCIFQPAEEGSGGAKEMIADGIFDRFPCDEVYAMHNWPGLKTGVIDAQPGPRMASSDNFDIVFEGKGGHAAMPHLCDDPVMACAQTITALQTLVSRVCDPVDPVVISVTQVRAGGDAYNIIPRSCRVGGTMRCFSPEIRASLPGKMADLVSRVSSGLNVQARVTWHNHGFPPTINHKAQAKTALGAALKTVGADFVSQNCKASMGAEDFSHFLEVKPGCYVFLGAGETSFPLHHPKYDFNDELLGIGSELFVNMALESLVGGTGMEDSVVA